LDRIDKEGDTLQPTSIPEEIPSKWEEQRNVFINRIKKRHSHLRKWAKRVGVSCFRLYDRDIPELPFIVDIYEKYLHIAEILRFNEMDDEEHDAWTNLMADAAARTLGLPHEQVFVKYRRRQKQTDQYERFSNQNKTEVVQENGLQFEVNLSDYLDTGLFLDHRITRQIVSDLALNAKVLNLFSYTGSFSVYAAAGGAQSTLSVDLSNTYTAWARRNLERNGFFGELHSCLSMDVFKFLAMAQKEAKLYDLIILDPPTFSNSKKMVRILDIQKDHVELITNTMSLLSKRGVLVFSNNFKRFKIDEQSLSKKFRIKDITNQTIPEDFQKKRPHRAYMLEHIQHK
jgi:23S rRNA G2069 N7-methylase RlmK/C1962 C5-methylase RlmI